MRIVASAPGRVNLIGEHTDYNGGRCLPFAIPMRTTATVTRRTDGIVRVRSAQRDGTTSWRLDGLEPGAVSGWAAYVAGVVWALREDGWALSGHDVTIDGQVPLGAGLSSSAALECAVATAIAADVGYELDGRGRRHLAGLCVRAESEFVGAPTGGMDQSVAMLATSDHALLLDFADGSAHPIPLPFVEAGLTVLVIDTGVEHDLSVTTGGYADRRAECEAAAAALGATTLRDATEAHVAGLDGPALRARARHVVTEERRVGEALTAVADGDWAGLGRILTDAHRSLRDDFVVSTPELDLAVDTAVGAGALGARLVGGGFGGSAIALVAESLAEHVTSATVAALVARGHAAPATFRVQPSAGAAVTTRG